MRLGFNTRVSFNSGPGGAERGLRNGIALFQAAERLGYQSGWAYQRHFDNYLSSPLPFFAAVGQHTERIMLSEGAGTTDLLTGGRLNLALSSGRTGFERVFGQLKTDPRAEGQRRLARFLQAVDGQVLDVVSGSDELVLFLPPAFGLAENERGLADTARYVGPGLGWVGG